MTTKTHVAAAPSSAWRNRITGTGEEAPNQLLANPANWRIHPKAQQDALAGALDQVGWVQQVLVNRRSRFVVDGLARVALALTLTRGEATVTGQHPPGAHRPVRRLGGDRPQGSTRAPSTGSVATCGPRSRSRSRTPSRARTDAMSEDVRPVERNPLVAAFARYVEALHRRYPDGPDEMRRERLAVAPDSANVIAMDAKREAGAA